MGGFVSSVVDTVGGAVSDAVSGVGSVVGDAGNLVGDAVNNISTSVANDPWGNLAKLGTAYFAPWALPAVSAVDAAANGANLGQIATSAGASYLGGQVGAPVGSEVATETGSQLAGNLAQGATAGATSSALQGGNPILGATTGAIGAGINTGLSNINWADNNTITGNTTESNMSGSNGDTTGAVDYGIDTSGSQTNAPAGWLNDTSIGTGQDLSGMTLSDILGNAGIVPTGSSGLGSSGIGNTLASLLGLGGSAEAGSAGNLGNLALAQLGVGGLGALSSYLGSQQQANAANQAAQVNQNMFNTITANQAPFRQAGVGATNTLADLLGTSGNVGATGYGSMAKPMTSADLINNLDPNYQFMLQQGLGQTQNQANALGGLVGGNALQGLNTFAQNYAKNAAQQAFNNYQTGQTNIYNRLNTLANLGQNAAANTGAQGTQLAANIGNQLANAGTASGGGIVGAANALGKGLTGYSAINALA